MGFFNLYEALNLDRGASTEQIELALVEKNKRLNKLKASLSGSTPEGLEEQAKLMRLQAEVNAHLLDPAKRAAYDARLEQELEREHQQERSNERRRPGSGPGGGLSPQDEAILGQAKFLEDHGEYKLALDAAREVVRQHPESAAAWNFLGEMALVQYQVEEATKALYQALYLAPQEWTISNNLAKCYLRLGRRKDAQRQFSETVRLASERGVTATYAEEQLQKMAAEDARQRALDDRKQTLARLLPLNTWDRLAQANRLLESWKGVAQADEIANLAKLIEDAGPKLFQADRRSELAEVLPIDSREKLTRAKALLGTWKKNNYPNRELSYLSGVIEEASRVRSTMSRCGMAALWVLVGAPALIFGGFMAYGAMAGLGLLGQSGIDDVNGVLVGDGASQALALERWNTLTLGCAAIGLAVFLIVLLVTVRSRRAAWKIAGKRNARSK